MLIGDEIEIKYSVAPTWTYELSFPRLAIFCENVDYTLRQLLRINAFDLFSSISPPETASNSRPKNTKPKIKALHVGPSSGSPSHNLRSP
jgi:hypothetical protein